MNLHLPLLLVALLASPTHATLPLTHDSKTNYVITAGDSPVEQTAARELQHYLHEVTGAEFPMRPAKEYPAGMPLFTVSSSPSLPTDSVLMKTDGRNIILSGGGTRGAIYAVDSFLEDVVGVRWWTSTDSYIPHNPSLSIPDLDVNYTPKLVYRECFNADVMRSNAEFAARLKLNGHHQSIPADFGGHYTILGWCHTSFSLMPPSEYFAKHPEWYSQNAKGKRVTTQLCWSDEGMRHELAGEVLRRIRKHPEAGIISVSQEDAGGYCQCDKCRAIAKEDGSEMGPLLRGVNAVAAEVAKEYPDFLVETLAYQWSRKPPRVTRPAKNVLIRLCSIEADFSHPLQSQDFGRDLTEWSKIADHLFVWNYVTNFSNYLIPHPNLNAIGSDLKFFADNHVVGVFEQGDAYNYPAGDFLELRVWLQAHLLWDPTRDQRALINEFLDGYYGPAGPYLLQYLDLINARSADPVFRRYCYHQQPDFLTHDDITRAEDLFNQAAAAVKGDATLEKRVAIQRLILDHTKLMRYDFPTELKQKPPEQVARQYEQSANQFIKSAQQYGVRNFSEALGFSAYPSSLRAAGMVGLPVDLPKPGTTLPDGQYDLQEDRFYLYKRGDLADIVDDPKASNGKAARMRGGHTEWAVQFHVPKGAPYTGKGPWRCSLVVRVDGTANGHAFTIGVYNNSTGFKARREVAMSETTNGQYRAYAFVLDDLNQGDYFWLSPANAQAIYVDRLFIQRAKE